MANSEKNISEIFTKLDDLKNVFKFAESIVPIIQSIIEFMEEMTPLLDTINSSISQSAGQIQAGTDRISDVTSATEMATTEILDLVDEIIDTLLNIQNNVKEANNKKPEIDLLFSEIITELEGTPNGEALIARLKTIQESRLDYQGLFEDLSKVSDKTNQITLALQVQDITSQQLASVNHLIESVHNRLNSLVSEIDESEYKIEDIGAEPEPVRTTFDSNASFTKGSKQVDIDSIINEHKEDNSKQQASQDDIDKLFS
ncbi:MAG: hypothetical protein JEY94_18645 [Melioribacteraceae bacterium]|nr:hypothetical protein [Melioribacteraceae bacterium]